MLNLRELERRSPGTLKAWEATQGGKNVAYPFDANGYPKPVKVHRISFPDDQDMQAEYRRAIAAPLKKSKSWRQYYGRLETWAARHALTFWIDKGPTQ